MSHFKCTCQYYCQNVFAFWFSELEQIKKKWQRHWLWRRHRFFKSLKKRTTKPVINCLTFLHLAVWHWAFAFLDGIRTECKHPCEIRVLSGLSGSKEGWKKKASWVVWNPRGIMGSVVSCSNSVLQGEEKNSIWDALTMASELTWPDSWKMLVPCLHK